MRGLVRTAVAGVVIVAAVGTGFGIAAVRATAPASVQPITACVHNGNSQLRLVTDSTSCGGDAVVSWNATVGSAAGPQAPNVGDVYTTAKDFGAGLDFGHPEDILKLQLPAGNYSLSSKVRFLEATSVGTASTEMSAGCTLFLGTNSVLDQAQIVAQDTDAQFTVPLQAVVSLTQPSTIRLNCLNAGINGVFPDNAKLTALVVGKVTVQPAPPS